jgi:DNA polymerase-3 subunit delta
MVEKDVKKPIAALDYLAQPKRHPARPVCAVFGDEAFLRRQAILALRAEVLADADAEFSLNVFDGDKTTLREVLDALATVALFGGGRRLVVVEDADDFVSNYREQLEAYVARPARNGVLALELASLPSNTRLYKCILESGLLLDCKTPPPGQLTKWLSTWTKRRHNAELDPAAAELMVEVIGPELGLLDQELAKLSLTVGEDRKITAEMVSRGVGGWRAKTAWEMLDAALDGQLPEALRQLDRLLAAGEQPIGLLGMIASTLRRLAAATRLVLQAEAARRRPDIRAALTQAGVKSFVLQKVERQLRLLGRHRGSRLYRWLLEADLDLKGRSRMPPRLILERLLVRLSAAELKTQ